MKRTGVTVVSGFLGSGKTTLLRRIVADPAIGPQAAVIVNELGSLGLDEELIRGAARSAALDLRQLVSGCVCCTLRGDLVDALRELSAGRDRDRPAPAHIFIETSGAARASEVSYAINAIRFDAPFHTEAVLTLVDARNAARGYREDPDIFADQLRTADAVLLNKADLLPGEAERAALLDWLRPLAPRATWLWTEQADVSPRLLLGLDLPPSAPSETAAEEQAHRHGLTARTVQVPWPVSREGLETLLEDLAGSIYRIKGVVDAESGGVTAPLLVQAVGDSIDLEPLPADAPLRETERRLIFIGAHPDADALVAALRQIRVADQG